MHCVGGPLVRLQPTAAQRRSAGARRGITRSFRSFHQDSPQVQKNFPLLSHCFSQCRSTPCGHEGAVRLLEREVKRRIGEEKLGQTSSSCLCLPEGALYRTQQALQEDLFPELGLVPPGDLTLQCPHSVTQPGVCVCVLNEEIIHHTLFSLQSYVGHTERQADLTSKQQQRLWEGSGGAEPSVAGSAPPPHTSSNTRPAALGRTGSEHRK